MNGNLSQDDLSKIRSLENFNNDFDKANVICTLQNETRKIEELGKLTNFTAQFRVIKTLDETGIVEALDKIRDDGDKEYVINRLIKDEERKIEASKKIGNVTIRLKVIYDLQDEERRIKEIEKIRDEQMKEIVEFSQVYFSNIDESFYGGLAKLLLNICERMEDVYVDDSVKDDTSHLPPNVDLKIFDIVEEFYRGISPTLGDMARNALRNLNVYMTEGSLDDEDRNFILERKGEIKSKDDADSENVPLEKSWDAIVTTAHEVAHRFILIDNTTDYSDQKNCNENRISGTFDYLIGETIAIYAELLCIDFIKEKYGIDCLEALIMRYNGLKKLNNSVSKAKEMDYLRNIKKYVKLLKIRGLNETNMLEYRKALYSLIDTEYSDILFNSLNIEKAFDLNKALKEFESHRIGFILATYLHQLSIGNKEKQVGIFYDLIKTLSYFTEFDGLRDSKVIESGTIFTDEGFMPLNSFAGTDEILSLQNTGLPIAKGGKLQINDDDIKAILEAFDQALLRDKKSILKDKKEREKSEISMDAITRVAIKEGISEIDIKGIEKSQARLGEGRIEIEGGQEVE